MLMSIIAPFHSQCDRNWKKISTVFILHQGWLHNNTTCQMRQLHCSITFFLSFFYLFDVSWIKAYCRGENTQTRMKDMVEGDCYGFGSYRINVQSDADGSLKYNPFRLIFPPKSLTNAPAGRCRNMPWVFVLALMLTPCSPAFLDMHPHHASPYFSGALRWKSISFAKQSGRLPQHRGVMESDGWPPYREPWDRV